MTQGSLPDIKISLPPFEDGLYKITNVLKTFISNNILSKHRILGTFLLQRRKEWEQKIKSGIVQE